MPLPNETEKEWYEEWLKERGYDPYSPIVKPFLDEISRRTRAEVLEEVREVVKSMNHNQYDPEPKSEVVQIGWEDARHALLSKLFKMK